jgi:tripartite-type tricarboxylate transporter receptor subunit TctC
MRIRLLFVSLFCVLSGAAPIAAAQDQDFPSKPIRIIAPFPPGGATDLTARIIAEGFRQAWGHPAIVENRPGASGIIGAEATAKAPADGYTVVLGSMSLHCTLPMLDERMGQVQKALTPIGMIGTTPSYVLVPASLNIGSIKELIAYVKANPGKYPYGSAGAGASQHIFGEQFKRSAALDMFHVPYKGSGAMVTDLVAGRLVMAVEQGPATMAHIKSGALKPLAVASLKRTPVLPNVPTLDESGLTGFEATIWLSIYGPAGIPRPVVAKLNAEMGRILTNPELRARLVAVGIDPEAATPEALLERQRRDTQKYQELIKAANIRLE